MEVFTLYKLFLEKITLHKEKINDSFIKRDLITIHTGRRTFATVGVYQYCHICHPL